MKNGSDAYSSYHFLKEFSENFQRKYVNCSNRLSFLARVLKNCKKCTFLDKLRAVTQEKKHENWTTSFFHLFFLLHCL